MKLKNDQKLYNQMSLNCLESSKKFEDLESFKIKLLDIINKLWQTLLLGIFYSHKKFRKSKT